mmetsp:Transcript_139726/g.434627  ORF Transcript_139726/g.434627 Transcript_139726/m.434627 type:complete len:346 (-) Transcript_139726:869-1906(-)
MEIAFLRADLQALEERVVGEPPITAEESRRFTRSSVELPPLRRPTRRRGGETLVWFDGGGGVVQGLLRSLRRLWLGVRGRGDRGQGGELGAERLGLRHDDHALRLAAGLGALRQVQRRDDRLPLAGQHRASAPLRIRGQVHGRQEPLRRRGHDDQTAPGGPEVREPGPQDHDDQGTADVQPQRVQLAGGDYGVGVGLPRAGRPADGPVGGGHLHAGTDYLGHFLLQGGPARLAGPHHYRPRASGQGPGEDRARPRDAGRRGRALPPQVFSGDGHDPAHGHHRDALLVRHDVRGGDHRAPRAAAERGGPGVCEDHRRDALRGDHAPQAYGLHPHGEDRGLRGAVAD